MTNIRIHIIKGIRYVGNSQTMFAPTMQNGDEDVFFTYGINGSIRKRYDHQTQNTDYYYFNASGNLKTCGTDMQISVYGYNSANTRTYKVNLFNANQWVNGQPQPIQPMVQNAMFYPNTYINFTQAGEYTKHYYNGTERIASRLGDNTTTIALNNNILEDRKLSLEEHFRVDIHKLIYETVPIDMPPFIDVNTLQLTGTPNDIYYYHPNHLGSTSFVTDQNQTITQGFLYAPFGEITTEYNINFGNNVIPKYSFNAKELDEETGMFYYEARYYAPPVFTSRDPMFEKYFWMSPYAYCANNPVKYVDPDGNWPFWFDLKSRQSGWGHQAPQRLFGYSRFYDDNMNLLFDIQGVEFKMERVTLRLWKGDYGKHRALLPCNISVHVGGAGGEIGLYNPNKSLRIGENDFEASMTKADLDKMGLIGTDLKVYNKQTGALVVSRSEESSFWTTSFSWDKKEKGEELYSVNTFTFKNTKYASKFFEELKRNLKIAYEYEYNYNEPIKIRQKNNRVTITWGIGE